MSFVVNQKVVILQIQEVKLAINKDIFVLSASADHATPEVVNAIVIFNLVCKIDVKVSVLGP